MITALLLLSIFPTLLFAHSDVPDSADGVSPPPPPEIPPPSETQTLYQIDPNQSIAQYSVQEVYVGTIDGKLVVGQTSGITGDVLIDWSDPANSQLGMVTVNVEQLTSDSKQRDRQIRQSYLESSLYPEAVFIPETEQEFPATIAIGDTVSFVLHGFLTVHDVTILSDWMVELTLESDRLIGRATTDILMSDFGVGPISIVGLLSTEDQMQLSLDFVAMADGEVSPVVLQPAASTTNQIESALKFSDIQPIIETKCVGCHVEGEIGHTIYPMETVDDIVEYADDLALVIQTGFMPPWSPSHMAPKFANDRSLSDGEIAMMLEWIAAGAPNDVSPNEPLVDRAPEGQTLREDILLTMPEPYVPIGDITDDYRCFLLDPQLPNGGFVTGNNVLPGDRRVVHHVILFQAGVDSLEEAAEKAAEDDLPGWECFGGTGLTSGGINQLGGSVGSWVPGSSALFWREGDGIWVAPGNQIVMQVHYNYESGFLPDQTSAVLQIEAADSGLTPLHTVPLLAPVEIPCPVDSSNEACNRDVSLAEKPEADQVLAEQLFMLCDKEIDDYAEETAENATTFCDWRIPVDGELVTVGGHMHTRGKSLSVTLHPESVNETVLQDLPIWDFNWQGSYQFETPIPVEKGDVMRLTCAWDNTQYLDPNDATYLTWGEGTNDEMCLTTVRIRPTNEFIDVSSTALFADSIAFLPNWLPTWGRIGSMLWFMLPTVTRTVIWVVLFGLIALAVYFYSTMRNKTSEYAS